MGVKFMNSETDRKKLLEDNIWLLSWAGGRFRKARAAIGGQELLSLLSVVYCRGIDSWIRRKEKWQLAKPSTFVYRQMRAAICRYFAKLPTKTTEQLDCHIIDNNAISPVENACLSERRIKIHDVLKSLTYRERMIIKFRYGLHVDDYGTEYNYSEIGRIFGIAGERVRQIEKEAITKLQHPARLNKLQG